MPLTRSYMRALFAIDPPPDARPTVERPYNLHVAESSDQITLLLMQVRKGDSDAEERLVALVYDDLRRMAHACMRRERAGHTLQPTALLNEAWIRLVRDPEVDWQNRAHFFALAARAMRHILVEYARSHRSLKRGGERNRIELIDALLVSEDDLDKILFVEQSLQELQQWDRRQAQIVEMRYFGGLTEDEISAALGLSSRTVKRDWRMARGWLAAKMAR